MTKELYAVSMLLTLTLTMGCNNSSDSGSTAWGVVYVADDDPEMVSAIGSAKESLSFFEKNWKTMKSDGYSLKFALPTIDGDLEHIWFPPPASTAKKSLANVRTIQQEFRV